MTLSILPLDQMLLGLKRPCRLAALDIGKKTIGLALCTPDWRMVTPLTTIQRGKIAHDALALDKALSGFAVKGVVIGLPLNMDGSEGAQAQSVRDTITALLQVQPKSFQDVVIAFADERLSTASAEELLHDNMRSRHSAKESGALDAVAAQVILQRVLDHIPV